jgi:hypothetical protein
LLAQKNNPATFGGAQAEKYPSGISLDIASVPGNSNAFSAANMLPPS